MYGRIKRKIAIVTKKTYQENFKNCLPVVIETSLKYVPFKINKQYFKSVETNGLAEDNTRICKIECNDCNNWIN